MKNTLKKLLSALLALTLLASLMTPVVTADETEAEQIIYQADGATARKISNPTQGEQLPDGLQELPTRMNAYAWCMGRMTDEYGDYIYIGTNRNILYASVFNGIVGDIDTTTIGEFIKALTNDEIYTDCSQQEFMQAVIVRYNLETGKLETWFDPAKHPFVTGFDPATGNYTYNMANRYFSFIASFRSTQYFKGSMYINATVMDPLTQQSGSMFFRIRDNSATEPEIVWQDFSSGIMLRALTTSSDGESLYFGSITSDKIPGYDTEWQIAIYEMLVDGDSVDIHKIADAAEPAFLHYEYDVVPTNADISGRINTYLTEGGNVWELIEFQGELYMTLMTNYGGMVFKAHKDPTDPNANQYGWIWEEFAGESAGSAYDPGFGNIANYTFSPIIFKNDLYFLGFTNTFDPFVDAVVGLLAYMYPGEGQSRDINKFFDSLYTMERSLNNECAMFRLTSDGKMQMIMGDEKDCPDNIEYVAEYGAAFNDEEYSTTLYTWRPAVYKDRLYIGTFDAYTLYKYITKLTNGDLMNMTEPEFRQQLDYVIALLDFMEEDEEENPVQLQGEEDPMMETLREAAQLYKEGLAARTAGVPVLMADDETDEDMQALINFLVRMQQTLDKEATTASIEEMLLNKDETAQELTSIYNLFDTFRRGADADTAKTIETAMSLIADVRDGLQDANEEGLERYVRISHTLAANDNPGFELYSSEDGIHYDTITLNGFNDEFNYGVRTMCPTEYGLMIGTANPFYGAQLWQLNLNDVLEVTPESAGATASKTITVGDSVTLRVTNGSSSNFYTFSATVQDGSVASVSPASVGINPGDTGDITVTGLKVGTTTITVSSGSSGGYYGQTGGRTAVITLNVKAASSGTETPVEGIVYEMTDHFEMGETYLIVNTDNGTGKALVNNKNSNGFGLTDVTVADGKIIVSEALTSAEWLAQPTTSGSAKIGLGNDGTVLKVNGSNQNSPYINCNATSYSAGGFGYTSGNHISYPYGNPVADYFIGSDATNGFKASGSETDLGKVYIFVKTGTGSVDPVDPPVSDATVELTPASSNSPTENVTLNKGETLTVKITNGSSSSAYDFTVSFSKSGIASADKTTANIAAGATEEFTITALEAGTVTITFQNNGTYSNRKATINLTVKGDGTDDPVDPPVSTGTVELTPASSNSPEENVTLNKGETLTVKVTNGSSSSAYDFTVSFSTSGIASADKTTANIAAGATEEFTITADEPGTVTITFQNNNSYGASYARKAYIHLTVNDAEPAKSVQTVTASDINATFGETGVKIAATTSGDGALSYALKSGEAVTVDENGSLTIVKAGTAVITVTAAETDNYEEGTKDVNVTVAQATPSYTVPEGLTAQVGQTLADITLPAGFAWEDASASVGAAGTKTFNAKYTPADTVNYKTVTGIAVTVTVTAKNAQTVTAADVDTVYASLGAKINASTDGDGALSYTVKSGEAVTVDGYGNLTIVKAGSAVITVTAAETDTYAMGTKDVNVTVAQAVPAYTVPSGLTATEGDTLLSVTLPAGFAWKDATESVGDAGTRTFKAIYTPDDTVNYQTVTGIDVPVTVKSAHVPADPNLINYTKTAGAAYATVTFENDNRTAVVSCAKACIVAVKTGDDAYTRLTAVKRSDNVYTFDLSGYEGEFDLIVALKGDANLDGYLNTTDLGQARTVASKKRTFNKLQMCVMDFKYDGIYNSTDLGQLRSMFSGKLTLQW